MSVNKCPTILDCQCIPNPFRNLSAENPDPPDFFSFEFFDAQVPLGAPDTWWGTTVGQDGCFSTDSQQSADDCALKLAEQDVWNTWPDNGRAGTAIPLFGNHQTQCVIPCPAGFDPFIYTLPAGTAIARTQEEADALAASYCVTRGQKNRVCKPTPKPITISAIDAQELNDLAPNGIVAILTQANHAGYFYNGSLFTLPVGPGASFQDCDCCNENFQFGCDNFGAGLEYGIWQTPSLLKVIGSAVGITYLPSVSSAGRRMTSDGLISCVEGFYNPNTSTFRSASAFGTGILNPSVRGINTDGITHWICAQTTFLGPTNHMYRYIVESDTLQEITPPGHDGTNFGNVNGGVNALGHVSGIYYLAGVQKGFLSKNGAAGVDIGLIGPASMNDSDLIVGTYNHVPKMWTQGDSVQIIPALPGLSNYGFARDVNNSGDIVGEMSAFNVVYTAFLYRNGVTYDLFALLPTAYKSASQWTALTSANFINDAKQIVGFGTYNGVPQTGYIMSVPDGSI